MSWYGFRPYVCVAQRRANAAREMAKLARKGHAVTPVCIEGRQIASTFWGKAWCENLESYSDFSNRLPRGRTYVRNGSVVDLQIQPGKITARVSGSELYEVEIAIKPLSKNHWQAISGQCAGKIASVLELLQGRLSKGVMEIITHRQDGLFPKPAEISLACSCPDWAGMCKHVAATLYGVGARLDQKPNLLFVLRQVDHLELIERAAAGQAFAPAAASDKKTIAAGDLGDVFGIELDSTPSQPAARAPRASSTAAASASRPPQGVDSPIKSRRGAAKAAARPAASGKSGGRKTPKARPEAQSSSKRKKAGSSRKQQTAAVAGR